MTRETHGEIKDLFFPRVRGRINSRTKQEFVVRNKSVKRSTDQDHKGPVIQHEASVLAGLVWEG